MSGGRDAAGVEAGARGPAHVVREAELLQAADHLGAGVDLPPVDAVARGGGVGVVLIAASRSHPAARSANLAVGATYVLLAVVGPFIDDTAVDVIALNSADHVLHLLSGLVLAGTALAADKSRARV